MTESSDCEENLTPPDILNAAKEVTNNLIPASRENYMINATKTLWIGKCKKRLLRFQSVGKEMPASPGAPAPAPPPPPPPPDDPMGAELLGSLTTQQQQRTSARVIKKLRLDDAIALDKKENQESDTSQKPKEEEKDPLKLVKPRLPKAIWLTDEKNLFFEALNEYGKDFDAITTYICAKMKKKGVPDVMLKTKNQVSHFYYRTWHKLSKYVHFDENVKKVAQELYALINYGELRKRLPSVKESTCARLSEMVVRGSLAVRARGRGLRVRTPPCRALRTLNQITERSAGPRVCGRCVMTLRARDTAAWARVQSAAHNPRAAAELPLRVPLVTLLRALEARWRGKRNKAAKLNGSLTRLEGDEKTDLESHLHMETERGIVREQRLPRKLALHIGPSPKTTLHIPQLSASDHLYSHNICFASYLERMGRNAPTKIRTPKRQRKDSEKDKEPPEPKKLKIEPDTEPKPLDIDETAIDGIELMAIIKHNHEEEEKPSTEDEKEKSGEEKPEEEVDPLKEEKEKDSFSEMEDDEKCNDTDNESDHKVGGKVERKFKNLKVKFRIRPKKRGGSIYTLITGSPAKEPSESQPNVAEDTPKLSEDAPKIPEDAPKAPEDVPKIPEDVPKVAEEEKPDIDVEFVTRQIRKGWSVLDAGQLTVGDLYLMFGARSKIELDYWWAEPTPPLSPPLSRQTKPDDKTTDKNAAEKKDRDRSEKKTEKERKIEKTPEKNDSSVDEDKEKSDTDIFSPKNTFGQDSNDGLSGDERKNEQIEQLSSPEHKFGTLPLASKLINRPEPNDSVAQHHLSLISDRLKRLLALAGNPHAMAATGLSASTAKCNCGHVCSQKKNNHTKQQPPPPVIQAPTEDAPVFRHPTPIAPKNIAEVQMLPPLSVKELPRWHSRGGRTNTGPVVVQRLLPLLPKLNQHHQNLIPVKLVSSTPPPPPRLAPRPAPPDVNSEISRVYILSESKGQFFFHDGDRRIPMMAPPSLLHEQVSTEIDEKEEYVAMDSPMQPKSEASSTGDGIGHGNGLGNGNGLEVPEVVGAKSEASSDIANFLPSESWSLSPSRLLAAGGEGEAGEGGAWLGGGGEFSLSSFLGHLEARDQKYHVDSHLQSLMVESSVDYVAKFADLAAEVTDDTDPLAPTELP